MNIFLAVLYNQLALALHRKYNHKFWVRYVIFITILNYLIFIIYTELLSKFHNHKLFNCIKINFFNLTFWQTVISGAYLKLMWLISHINFINYLILSKQLSIWKFIRYFYNMLYLEPYFYLYVNLWYFLKTHMFYLIWFLTNCYMWRFFIINMN